MPNRIRSLRHERAKAAPGAFTIAAVAQRIGVTEWSVRAWETGRARPTARHARRLARDFGIAVSELGLGDLALRQPDDVSVTPGRSA